MKTCDMTIADLIGKTLVSVSGAKHDDEIKFVTKDGYTFLFNHHYNCCEGVWVEDIDNDLDVLIGNPILSAEEIISNDESIPPAENHSECWTWTFYKFSTIKGSVTIRWFGTSNGYYSESVDLDVTKTR